MYVFGGKHNKQQISSVDQCKLKSVGQGSAWQDFFCLCLVLSNNIDHLLLLCFANLWFAPCFRNNDTQLEISEVAKWNLLSTDNYCVFGKSIFIVLSCQITSAVIVIVTCQCLVMLNPDVGKLPFLMYRGACAQRDNSEVFICFHDRDKGWTMKTCHRAKSPLDEFEKLPDSNHYHRDTRIAVTSGKCAFLSTYPPFDFKVSDFLEIYEND